MSLPSRPQMLRRALALEGLTLGWNVVEGIIAVGAGLVAGSVALIGFGLDSFVECASAGVLVWRLRAEQAGAPPRDLARIETRARKLVAGSLVLLALVVTAHATLTLIRGAEPLPSWPGILLLCASLAVMGWLARAKRRLALGLGSGALAADAFQTTACFWLSLVTLAGIGLNAGFGWWWADPVAAFGIAALVVVEARQAWRGEGCCAGACLGSPGPGD